MNLFPKYILFYLSLTCYMDATLTVFTLNSTVSWFAKAHLISVMIRGAFSFIHTWWIAHKFCNNLINDYDMK